ncbi:hypothetical protein NYE67_10915 [Solibacillus sp. FSL W8-0474]|uniref:hypothetical protein n=1 Tax=Solibacillus sp. FSL W8-0474 TaxID=2975336 RepID=UPI0030FA8B39
MKNNLIQLKVIQEAKTKQERINQLGEILKDLFLNNYGYTPYNLEFLPEKIEIDGIEISLCGNGHEDCPRYNYNLMYCGEIEEENIAIYIEYYRATVFQKLVIQNIYVEDNEPQPYEYNTPPEFIVETMAQLLTEELL